jgi:hypothetical protein
LLYMSFFDVRMFITPLVSSNSSCNKKNTTFSETGCVQTNIRNNMFCLCIHSIYNYLLGLISFLFKIVVIRNFMIDQTLL